MHNENRWQAENAFSVEQIKQVLAPWYERHRRPQPQRGGSVVMKGIDLCVRKILSHPGWPVGRLIVARLPSCLAVPGDAMHEDNVESWIRRFTYFFERL